MAKVIDFCGGGIGCMGTNRPGLPPSSKCEPLENLPFFMFPTSTPGKLSGIYWEVPSRT